MDMNTDANILIVDDEQDTLFALKRYLRLEPYTTHFAKSAEQALETCDTINIAVVVTDLRMPGMSGKELLDALQERHPLIVRIIISGTVDIGMIIDSINSGVIFRFIPKPIEPERMKAIIRDAIAFYRMRLEHREMSALAEKQNRYLTQINDELRLMTTRLQDSKQRFRAMNDAAFDPIFLLDAAGRIVYANVAAETIFGYTRKEFLSLRVGDLMTPENIKEGIIEKLLTSLNTAPKELEIDCLKKDGTNVNIGISVNTAKILSVPHIIMIARDNTLRAQEEKSRLELEKVQKTLESQIERRLLQRHVPITLEGASISHFMLSSGHLNGDFSDFIVYEQQLADILLGDVMGHGILSALVGSGMKSLYLRTIARKSFRTTVPELQEIVTDLHRECIHDLLDIEIYATMLFFRLDLKHKRLSMIDCGHTSTIHVHAADGTCSLLKGSNLPIGMVEEQDFACVDVPIEHGDTIVIYSDGITEAQLPDRSFFGEDRLIELVTRHQKACTDDILLAIRQELSSATGGTTFEDDASCIVIRIS